MSANQRVMNRIDFTMSEKSEILNVYFTAGYPKIEDTIRIAKSLQEGGADILEIGIPFSDPIADGPTIQESSTQALKNGMTLTNLFEQLTDLRKEVVLPVLLMGYVNPIIQFGIKEFCKECERVGVDGIIVPDLPIQEYLDEYQELFQVHGLYNIFLISPNTSEERIRLIDEQSNGFIYMVSSSSITGAKKRIDTRQIAYFDRIRKMHLKNPRLIGFGISDHASFKKACEFAEGAIIGSAFINNLKRDTSNEAIIDFVKSIKQ
ncbi:MAG: tryptophan synthase subunit alpha [Bacteroidota bacterium]